MASILQAIIGEAPVSYVGLVALQEQLGQHHCTSKHVTMAGHAPYLMPDGSKLSQYLADNQLERPHARRHGKNKKGTKWLNESEDMNPAAGVAELESFYKAGRNRRRRCYSHMIRE